MSVKWRENKAWEDANLTGAWRPVKWVLRAFSSITLAVVLLLFVSLYGVSASIPVGLLALGATYIVYALTLVAFVAVVLGIGAAILRPILRNRPRVTRVVATVAMILILTPLGVLAWRAALWPALRWDPIAGTGLRLFASFVRDNSSITLRRLPGIEMSELEFYAWWPLRLALLLFVVNLVVATVRRIEFTFKNIGVLTVHTGIVTIALGSIYYSGLKLEGDTLLLAGRLGEDGRPGLGPPQDRFYDGTRVALYVDQGWGMEQRLLEGVPRYNDYGLSEVGGQPGSPSAMEAALIRRPWTRVRPRDLSIAVPGTRVGEGDEGFRLRVVGYAYYATGVKDWVRAAPGDEPVEAVRVLHLYSDIPDSRTGKKPDGPVFGFVLAPNTPSDRIADNGVFGVEYTRGPGVGMPAQRWRDLAETLPEGTTHALVVETSSGERVVKSVDEGDEFTLGGYTIRVEQLLPEPPFPIITEGYRGATSGVAVVRITPAEGPAFDRYVYHRFPEIDQDVLGEHGDGRPMRRAPDPGIRVTYLECDRLQVYLDDAPDGRTRALVRQAGGAVRVVDSLDEDGWLREIVPMVTLRLAAAWDDAVRVERPSPVPPEEQDRRFIGTHDQAMLGVEVTAPNTREAIAAGGPPVVRRVVWVPFSKYVGAVGGGDRVVALPGGRTLRLHFGRVQHRLPGFVLQLVDFEMIAYDHRGAPRDYRSIVRVTPVDDAPFEAFEHVTKLNEPLRAPYRWIEERSLIANVAGRIGAGLTPHQFKLSQAGWDATGWERTQQQADAGLLPRPHATFTILGVGNNPGIHIIALGGVLMGLGIPWAFYLKPYLVRRERDRLRAAAEREPKPDRKSDQRPDESATPPAREAPALAPATEAGSP